MFRLAQGQLNLLETCPRKFQLAYLEQLASPIAPEEQETMAWGQRFHVLMQQRELGLPVEHLVREDPQMQRCLEATIAAAPEIFSNLAPYRFRESEHWRSLNFQGYLLTAVYDLLILEERQAQILDWKTYPRPQNRTHLARNWQTLLYPFILAETSSYLPEQISITYWFVQHQNDNSTTPEPQSLKFAYSQAQHQLTQTSLSRLLDKLTDWLQDYQRGEPFPQISQTDRRCAYCQFAIRCQRTSDRGEEFSEGHWMPDISKIGEVALDLNL